MESSLGGGGFPHNAMVVSVSWELGELGQWKVSVEVGLMA